LRTEQPAALALPETAAFALPDDTQSWPAAVAAELDAALPVRPVIEPLIRDIPNRPDPVHEPADVKFTFEGTRLRVDFLTDLGACLMLELRLPAAADPPGELTYEYGRGSGSSTATGEPRTGATGYPLPAPPRTPHAAPVHPPLFVWPVQPCDPALFVAAR
jgi:hypothetical protein